MPKRNLDGTVKAQSPFADRRGSGRSLEIQQFDKGQRVAGERPEGDLTDTLDAATTPALTDNNSLLNILRIGKHDGVSINTRLQIQAMDEESLSEDAKLRIRRERAARNRRR